MRRIFWLAAGLGAGATAVVIANRWARRQRERLAPANIGKQVGQAASDLASLAGQAWSEFRKGAEEREAELRESLDRPS